MAATSRVESVTKTIVEDKVSAGNMFLKRLGIGGQEYVPAVASIEELELELGVCIPFRKYTPEGVSLQSVTGMPRNPDEESIASVPINQN